MYKVMLVEDEKDLGTIVCKYLEKAGYEVSWFLTGEAALEHAKDKFHLWILDIMLPGNVNGYDLIKEIKIFHQDAPIIFTSARDKDIDKIMGLELGSDDYVSKPYSIRELMLRVKNLLARCYGTVEVSNTKIEYEPYVLDLDKRMVYLNEEIINLTSKEYDLLIFLLKNRTKAFSREQILNNIWGNEYYGSDRVVDDLLRRLRQKLALIKIETIYGYGYRLL